MTEIDKAIKKYFITRMVTFMSDVLLINILARNFRWLQCRKENLSKYEEL